MTRQKQRIMAITLIGVLLCIVSLLALHVGTIMIPIGGGVQSILNGMGIPVSFTEPISAEQEAVLWFIRMPRLIIGLLVGGALAIAGAVMQGVFQILWRIQVLWAYPQGHLSVPLLPLLLA